MKELKKKLILNGIDYGEDSDIKNEIGKTIFLLRVNAGKTREELANGLCSQTVLQRIEEGESFAEKGLIDALIQRLGKSPDKFEFVLGKKEYEASRKRMEIEQTFEAEQYEICKIYLNEFEKNCRKIDTLNRQYIQKMRFLLGDLQYDTLEEAEILIMNMLSYTSPQFGWEKMNECLLCIEECKIIYLLALTRIRFQCYREAKVILEKLLYYLETHFSDIEERIKLYPQVAYSLAVCYEEEKRYHKEKYVAKKAIDLLEQNGKIYLLLDLLLCYRNAFLEELKWRKDLLSEEEKECWELDNEIAVLYELREEFGNDRKKNRNNMSISHNYGGQNVHLVHEVLNKKRKMKGMTEEELSDGICEPETLSRLLNGKCIPSQNTYQLLAQSLEVDSERCRPYITATDYEIHEKRIQLGVYLQRKEYHLAEELFKEIEQKISQSIPRNRQFCLSVRSVIESRLRRIEWDKRLKYLEEAIQCTIPEYPNIPIGQLSLSRQEIVLLNSIANTYKMSGKMEEAVKIFEGIIESCQNSEVDILYYVESMTLTILNYAKWLGNVGRHKEAIDWYEKIIKMNVETGRGKYIGALLYGKSWNLYKISENNKEACQKYCRQAYYIANLMQEEKDKQFILEHTEKNFGIVF